MGMHERRQVDAMSAWSSFFMAAGVGVTGASLASGMPANPVHGMASGALMGIGLGSIGIGVALKVIE